ncbi:hypothetical protein YN1_7520 [Nanoarchaeota archaeon]
MEYNINIFGVYTKVIILDNEEELKKFRRICRDWDKYIVILNKEIIVPSMLLNRKILSKIRNLVIKRETSSKYENGKKITVHFYRIKLEDPIKSIIKQNKNIIDYKRFVENLVSQKYMEYYYRKEKKLNDEINKLKKSIDDLYNIIRQIK